MILDRIWRMKWRRNKYIARTQREIKNLRNSGKHKEANHLYEEQQREMLLWQEAIWSLRTDALIIMAERLDLPVSVTAETWRTSDEASRYLTADARYALSRAIRQEKKERLDHRMMWIKDVVIPILSALSVIGSLIVAYTALKLKH